MKYVCGKLLYKEDFIKGYIGFEDGIIKEIGKGSIKNPAAKGIIIPTFFNAHTHIGDSVAKDIEITNSLEEVMKPPDGLKHKILRESKSEDIIKSMKKTLIEMINSGTTQFSDFREGGAEGILQLEKAIDNLPIKPLTFARPEKLEYKKEEIDKILEKSEGIGVSSISDWDYTELQKISKHAKNKDKKFSLHASEDVREDIDNILDLKPDFLVHMTNAKDTDLEIVADNEIPIIVCPRANVFFGHIPNIPKMQKFGINLALGTDNVMINNPNMFREMEFTYKISRLKGNMTSQNIFKMATFPKILNPRNEVEVGNVANFMVLEIDSKNPYKAIVNHTDSKKIEMIVVGKYIRRRKE